MRKLNNNNNNNNNSDDDDNGNNNSDDGDGDDDDDDDDNNNCIERRKSRFFTISSLRRELSPTRMLKWPGRNRVRIACNTSNSYRVQHVVYHVARPKGQLSY